MSENAEQMLWGCCGNDTNIENNLKCIKCLKTFHHACLSMAEDSISPEHLAIWKCPACSIPIPKLNKKDHTQRNISNTRGSKRQALNSPPQSSPEKLNQELIRKTIEDSISKQMNELISKMMSVITETINRELKPIKEEISQMSESLNFLSKGYDQVIKEHEESKKAMIDLQRENLDLKGCINNLTSRLNQLEQYSRSSNIELQCVPEKKNENLIQIVTKLGSVVGYNILEQDIRNCTRIAKQDNTSSRPRSIVIQLGSPRIRDQLLASTVNYNKSNPENKLNSQLLGFSGDKSPIFVTEHLSPANKALHAATRKRANEKGYKYVWVRGGKIFVRKIDGSEPIMVKDIHILNKKIV